MADDELVRKWERILASQGLGRLEPRQRTPREERDLKARTRRRNRGT